MAIRRLQATQLKDEKVKREMVPVKKTAPKPQRRRKHHKVVLHESLTVSESV